MDKISGVYGQLNDWHFKWYKGVSDGSLDIF